MRLAEHRALLAHGDQQLMRTKYLAVRNIDALQRSERQPFDELRGCEALAVSEAGRRRTMHLKERETLFFEHQLHGSLELLMPFMGTRVGSLAQLIRWPTRGFLVL